MVSAAWPEATQPGVAMSAGKVLALIVVVASFAIIAVGVSWCCWCVRSCIGTADKSIQAVKSMATVADTMDSSAQVVKSSLISATFPTTATTATMTNHPRVVASEPRMLKQVAEVEARVSDVPTSKSADNNARSFAPKATRSDDNRLQKTSLDAGKSLQRRCSKVYLLHPEANVVPLQSVGRSFQPSVRESEAHGLKRANVESKNERASAVSTLELRNTMTDETPSRRSSGSIKSAYGRLLDSPEPLNKLHYQISERGSSAGITTAYCISKQQTSEPRSFAAQHSRHKRSSRVPAGREGTAVHYEEVVATDCKYEGSSRLCKDAPEKKTPDRSSNLVTEKQENERTASFKTPIYSDERKVISRARGATTEPVKRAGQKVADKASVKSSDLPWAGKRSLLRKAQRATALSPRRRNGAPEVSIVINVPKKEVSLLEVTKEQMLANANHCCATLKKESF
ncbi:hypothetical protein HPB51_023244 [Rhipicephalus microplus]|uniref:Uncharacterized protein n=1 Tax=Rhipicephalus microplus TaxID=6941 RepID=A0A9J6ECP8_RHIMP|nr:hypothetical protein HPB51_023244 [Rhipicephalus microplus]